jgi:AAA domain
MAKAGKREQAIRRIEGRIVPLSKSSPYVKLLFYGLNGRGKTTAATDAPAPIILDCNEEGTESVRYYEGDYISIKTWSDLVYAYWYLKAGKHNYKTVVVDTITMLQNICTRHVLKDGVDRDPVRDPKTMSQRDWGKLAEFMNPQLLDFRNLPMHVVFIAQQRQFDNEQEETFERVPDLSPKIRANATACVSVIGHFTMREFQRGKKGKQVTEYHPVMLTGTHDIYTACKSRLVDKKQRPILPRHMIDPSVNKILELRVAASQKEKK